MKNGQLDSLADVTPGMFAIVTGTLDSSTNTVMASGVNLVDKPTKSVKAGLVPHKNTQKK